MSGNFSIRKFEDHDADDVSRLIIDNLTTVNVSDYGPTVTADLSRYYAPQMLQEYARGEDLFVAHDDQAIVGTATLCHNRLRNVFVRTDRHRQGIGSQLVRHLEHCAAANGKLNVFLFTNESAMPFYQGLGYAIIDERPETIGDVQLRMTLMIKRIPHPC